MFSDLIWAKYHQVILSQKLSLSPYKSSHVIFADTVDLFKIPDVDELFWKGHTEAGLQNNF